MGPTQVPEVKHQHPSPESASLDPPKSLTTPPSSSTPHGVLTKRFDGLNLRTHSGHLPSVDLRNRGGPSSMQLPSRQGTVSKNQQYIRNPAGQASRKASHVSEPVRAMGNHSNFKPSSGPPRTLRPATWKSWDELRIKTFDLPPSSTVNELVSWFRAEGNVRYVEILEDRTVNGTRSAWLSFRPPPARPFWQQPIYSVRSGGKQVATCRFGAPERSQSLVYPSPVQPHVSYPETMLMKADSMDFGLIMGEDSMLGMTSVTSTVNAPIHLELSMKHKELCATFKFPIQDWRSEKPGTPVPKLGALNREEDLKFRIPLTEMIKIDESPLGRDSFALSFTPLVPPSFFKRVDDVQLSGLLKLWTDQDAWHRQTDVVYNPNSLKRLPITLKKPHAALDLGRWITYRFIFSRSNNDMQVYRKMHSALGDFNVKVVPCPHLQFSSDERSPIWEHLDRPVNQTSHVNAALEELLHGDQVAQLSFRVRYQLEVCISIGCFNEYNLDRDFVEKLAAMEPKSAQDLLEFVATEKKPIFKPMSIFALKSISGATSSAKIPDYCVLVRSATITPTTIRFHTPSVETSNRVIRQYSEYADRFLRIRFRDEQSESRIFSTTKESMNEVFTRMKRTFSNGVQIGDRRYEFLGYGNSQLREHSAYFFAPTAHVDTKRIRMWMGSFQDIKIVAKYASRLGQCFSTTRAIKGVVPHIVELKDIHHNGHNFTDGVGKISPFLAQLAASELGILQSNQATPSVFQFRLGGCKGVLTVWPTSAARDLHLRYSQYKFPAIHEGLEIIRWSQYACAKLNRQLILVLSTLGVEDGVFRRKIEIQLQDLSEAMTDSTKALALLQKYVDHNQMTLTIASIIVDGFHQCKEPFMLALLHLWKAWSLKYLKEKAQIAIDGGALLLGCVDETDQLQGHYEKLHQQTPGPGASLEDRSRFLPQIFVQLSRDPDDKGSSKSKIILGPVLLTRSPILHPGDVRVVCCVDIPELHHIKDAIVMPQNGDRDLPSMCSGGDLDGDDFLVIWDADLLPREWNYAPMDYTAPPPLIHERDITVDDMTTFFVTYMKNDSLGVIATSHVAVADQSDYGVKDERCLRLAQLHSQAVDFAKTGQPALMTPDLKPRRKPHFQMDKKKNGKAHSYHSPKILGQLYDQVKMTGFSPEVSETFDARILEAFEIPTAMLDAASSLKKDYDAAVRRIMAKYEIKTEFEVWSTFVLSHSWSNDFKFHEEIGQVSAALKSQFREKCIETAGGKGFDQLGIFVAAMYWVTADEIATAATQRSSKSSVNNPGIDNHSAGSDLPFISFSWIFYDILGKIARLDELPASPPDSTAPPYQLISEESTQLKTVKNKVQKGRSLVPTTGQVLDLETNQGVIHPGDLFRPFKSQYMKDLEEMEMGDNSHSDQSTSPVLSTSTSGELDTHRRHNSMANEFSPSISSTTSEQSSSLEESTTPLNSGELHKHDSNEAEEDQYVEEVVFDSGADRSSGKLLEDLGAEEVE